jgi:hypothetical protein
MLRLRCLSPAWMSELPDPVLPPPPPLPVPQHHPIGALPYSYNRYCFNDDYLPTWFADDEKKHFRPQLPVDKDTVERIKAQFRDIAARPIKKVFGPDRAGATCGWAGAVCGCRRMCVHCVLT